MDHFHQRHLPHEVPEGFPIFVTWNLKGAMPKRAIERLELERERLKRCPSQPDESPRDRRIRESKILFALGDRMLDAAKTGPLHLNDPHAAKIVEDAILFGVPERYALYAWCVMANHVHVLLKPVWELRKLMQGIKGFTAHQINKLQGTRARTLWQDESFDHWVRDDEELFRIIEYIENNPVAAGLCKQPDE